MHDIHNGIITDLRVQYVSHGIISCEDGMTTTGHGMSSHEHAYDPLANGKECQARVNRGPHVMDEWN